MDVDAIIKGLSEAQKRALRIVPETNTTSNRMWFPQIAGSVAVALWRRGLATHDNNPTAFTETGLAVRARLLEEGK